MSETIDNKVVEMQFDNRQFEQNVGQSISTLDKLKAALNLQGVEKGLDDVGVSAKRLDLSPIGRAAEAVSMKFSALQVAAFTALQRISNAAITAGSRFARALTIEPVSTGFNEYELKMNSIQTIMASTGETIDVVNQKLDELNTYSDRTIYSFSDMTTNIGKFTNAGVKLDDAVMAIQGISNEAAVSGANAAEASRAMYNFAQALSAGYVKLIDWKSIENANMATVEFKNQLLETAVASGTLTKTMDGMYKTEKGTLISATHMFNDTLQEQWMTSEVLIQTLKNYADETTEIGKKAFAAAQDVKTFTQLFDTLKEAAQSGWATTWQLIVGDLVQAKDVIRPFSEFFSDIIGKAADSRNKVIGAIVNANYAVKDLRGNIINMNGRELIFEALLSSLQAIRNILGPIGRAWTATFGTGQLQITKLITGFYRLSQALYPSAATVNKLSRTFKGLFAVLDIVRMAFKAVFDIIRPLFGKLGELGTSFLDITASVGDWLVNLRDSIKSGNVFGTVVDKIREFVTGATAAIKNFISSLKDKFESPLLERLKTRFQQLKTAVSTLAEGIKNFFAGFKNSSGGSPLLAFFQGLWNIVSRLAGGVLKLVVAGVQAITNAIGKLNFSGILDLINTLSIGGIALGIKKISESFESFGEIGTKFSGILGSIEGVFKSWQQSLKADIIMKIAKAIALLAASLLLIALIDSDKLTTAIMAITALFTELLGSLNIMSQAMSGKGSGAAKALATMIAMSASVLILAVSMRAIGNLGMEGIATSLLAVGAMLGMLIGTVNLLSSNGKNDAKMTAGISRLLAMVISVRLLVSSVKSLGKMQPAQAAQGLIGVTILLGELVVVVALLSQVSGNSKSLTKGIGSVLALAISVGLLIGSVKEISKMQPAQAAQGMIGVTILLGELVGVVALLSQVSDKSKHLTKGITGVIALVLAVRILVGSIKELGEMDTTQLFQGMLGVSAALLVLTQALNLLAGPGILKGAAALLIASGSLISLSAALKIIGSMNGSQIATSLMAIISLLGILAVAAAAFSMSGLLVAIIGLSAAIAAFGVGVLAAGAGCVLLAAGITALATAVSVGVTGIVAGVSAIVVGLIGLVPQIAAAVGQGIVTIIGVLADSAPAIAEGLGVMLNSMLIALRTYLPGIVANLVILLGETLIAAIDGLATYIPKLIQSLTNLIMSVFTGAADALKSLNFGSLLEGAVAIAALTGIMAALTVAAALVPGAIIGALGIGIVITEIIAIVAAIGALSQLPGLKWLISEGGDFLGQIGSAVGKFIGGVAGGIAAGMSANLPDIGSNLSEFMETFKPFLDAVQAIPPETITNVQVLVDVIERMSTVKSNRKMDDILDDFGSFGAAIADFSASVSSVSLESVMTGAMAGTLIAQMADALPNSGGVGSWFAGDNEMGDFAENLMGFGAAIADFSDATSTVVTENVAKGAAAGKIIAEMATTLPNSGGVVSWFQGDNELGPFAEGVSAFGTAIANFSDAVSNVSEESVDIGSRAGLAIINMAREIPNSGGVGSWFAGDNDIGAFGTKLKEFGDGIATYYDSISGVDTSTIGAMTTELYRLLYFASSLSGLDTTGFSNFETFLSGIDDVIINAAIEIAQAAQDNVQAFYDAGASLSFGLVLGLTSNESLISSGAIEMVSGVVASANTQLGIGSGGGSLVFRLMGYYINVGLAAGIRAYQSLPVGAVQEVGAALVAAFEEKLAISSPSKVMKQEGQWIVMGLAEGITEDMSAEEAAEKKAQNIVSAFQTVFDKAKINIGLVDKELSFIEKNNGVLSFDENGQMIFKEFGSLEERNDRVVELLKKNYDALQENVATAAQEYQFTAQETGEESDATKEAHGKLLDAVSAARDAWNAYTQAVKESAQGIKASATGSGVEKQGAGVNRTYGGTLSFEVNGKEYTDIAAGTKQAYDLAYAEGMELMGYDKLREAYLAKVQEFHDIFGEDASLSDIADGETDRTWEDVLREETGWTREKNDDAYTALTAYAHSASGYYEDVAPQTNQFLADVNHSINSGFDRVTVGIDGEVEETKKTNAAIQQINTSTQQEPPPLAEQAVKEQEDLADVYARNGVGLWGVDLTTPTQRVAATNAASLMGTDLLNGVPVYGGNTGSYRPPSNANDGVLNNFQSFLGFRNNGLFGSTGGATGNTNQYINNWNVQIPSADAAGELYRLTQNDVSRIGMNS